MIAIFEMIKCVHHYNGDMILNNVRITQVSRVYFRCFIISVAGVQAIVIQHQYRIWLYNVVQTLYMYIIRQVHVTNFGDVNKLRRVVFTKSGNTN